MNFNYAAYYSHLNRVNNNVIIFELLPTIYLTDVAKNRQKGNSTKLGMPKSCMGPNTA